MGEDVAAWYSVDGQLRSRDRDGWTDRYQTIDRASGSNVAARDEPDVLGPATRTAARRCLQAVLDAGGAPRQRPRGDGVLGRRAPTATAPASAHPPAAERHGTPRRESGPYPRIRIRFSSTDSPGESFRRETDRFARHVDRICLTTLARHSAPAPLLSRGGTWVQPHLRAEPSRVAIGRCPAETARLS